MHKTKLFLAVPVAFLMLTACATDGNKPVQPPVVTARPEKPTDATIAWSKLLVTDLVTLEKAGRDKGLPEDKITETLVDTTRATTKKVFEASPSDAQILLGLQLASADAANTPLTRQAIAVALEGMQGAGSCRICK